MERGIGEGLHGFQAMLGQAGESLESFIKKTYVDKWTGDTIYHAMAIRTTFVNAMQNYLTKKGLFNLERVSMSPVTDPLAHDIEHSPTISYKGIPYKTTHSMIYSKFLACFNKKMKGIYIDSPNIRLELESPLGVKRKKYLVDFSQMDIEWRRGTQFTYDDYINNVEKVLEQTISDMDDAIDFFEDMIIEAVTLIKEVNADSLEYLGVQMVVPTKPFPRYTKDEAVEKFGKKDLEKNVAKDAKSPFFWITGLMRENYDLIYPYINKDGSRKAIKEFKSENIFNYDLCAQSIQADGSFGEAYEIMSGAIREWLYEPIIKRLIDNRIIKEEPAIEDGQIVNIEELEGYGPFLAAANAKDSQNQPLFPSTMGGGLGIERALFAMLNGKKITQMDDLTMFGKNPDSHPVYLY
jgi:aspartyl/asparaginyl-tRNA synthetase